MSGGRGEAGKKHAEILAPGSIVVSQGSREADAAGLINNSTGLVKQPAVPVFAFRLVIAAAQALISHLITCKLAVAMVKVSNKLM